MFHLVKFNYVIPVIFHSCKSFSSCMRYINNLDVPPGGISLEIYDRYGQFFGLLYRAHPYVNATFIKSSRYGTKDSASIWFAHIDPQMGSRSRNLLDCCYYCGPDGDFVRFCSENQHNH